LLSTYESHLEQAEVVRNTNKTLENAINSLDNENEDLKSLVAELEARPAEIRFITKTETVVVSQDPILVTPNLPGEHLFTLEQRTVVARFAKLEEQYAFETYDLGFRNSMVITNNRTAATLQIKTSFDDEWHEVPVDVQVNNVREQKLFEPHLGLGLTASAPSWEATASVFMTTLHPHDNIDLLGLRVSANTKYAALGIDPLGYNIGSNLPVFTDLWIYGGASLNTELGGSIDLTLGSKL
jgi:hypothetical protein